MKDTMEYNGYFGSVHYNDDDKVFYGKLRFIRALVSYEGTDVISLRAAFEEAVDDYLEFCKETGKQPEKPFKGSFNLRIDPELHKRLVSNAMSEGKTLNTFVKDLLQRSVEIPNDETMQVFKNTDAVADITSHKSIDAVFDHLRGQ